MQGTKEIDNLVFRLRHLQQQRDRLDSEIESIKDLIKKKLTQEDEDTILGPDYKITWKEVQKETLDVRSLRRCEPKIADYFTRTTSYRQFIVK